MSPMCHQIIGGIRPRHRACMQVVISMSLRDILAGPASFLSFFFFFINVDGCSDQLACTSTNLTDPEVNDHISF